MKLPAIIILLFFATGTFAQEASKEAMNPLILIDSLQTYNESMILHPSKFISISTVSAQKATELYGSMGKFGVIRIQTTPGIQFVRLNAILDQFNVDNKYRTLKVCINKLPVTDPEKILADIKEIRNVEIVSEEADKNLPSKEPTYINIVTL